MLTGGKRQVTCMAVTATWRAPFNGDIVSTALAAYSNDEISANPAVSSCGSKPKVPHPRGRSVVWRKLRCSTTDLVSCVMGELRRGFGGSPADY